MNRWKEAGVAGFITCGIVYAGMAFSGQIEGLTILGDMANTFITFGSSIAGGILFSSTAAIIHRCRQRKIEDAETNMFQQLTNNASVYDSGNGAEADIEIGLRASINQRAVQLTTQPPVSNANSPSLFQKKYGYNSYASTTSYSKTSAFSNGG